MHHHGTYLFNGFEGIIAFIIVVGIIFFIIMLIHKHNDKNNDAEIRDGLNSQDLLKKRFDSGEITTGEYEYMQKEFSVQPDCLEFLNRRYAKGLMSPVEYRHAREELFEIINIYAQTYK